MIHLLNDLGLYKGNLKKALLLNGRGDREQDELFSLLERRGQQYTLEEAKQIVEGTIYFAHHDAVLDHPEDYTPLQLRAAKQAERKYEIVLKDLNKLIKQRSPQYLAGSEF